MTNQDILDNIEGSVKKKQYLDAFLLQSTYLEGVVRLYALVRFNMSTSTWAEPTIKEGEVEKKAFGNIKDFLQKEVRGYSFDMSINFLGKTGVLEKELVEKLNKYKTTRNKIIHRLITEASGPDFDNGLREACDLGQEILKNDHFQLVVDAITDSEKG